MADLLGAIAALAPKLDVLGANQQEFRAQLDAQGVRLEAQGTKQDDLRIVLMERMDRLQDTMSDQKDDMDVLLGLIDGTHRMA